MSNNRVSGFPWLVDIPNRQRWVKEWNDDVDREAVESDLCAVSKRLFGGSHVTKGTGGSASRNLSDSLESEQVDMGRPEQ